MHLVSWDNAVNRDRAELIFSNRNQEYGGYVIRRDYEKLLVYALLYTLAGIALIVAVPGVIGLMSHPITVAPTLPYDPPISIDPSSIEKPIVLPPHTISPPPIGQSFVLKPSPDVPDQVGPDPTPLTNPNGSPTGASTVDPPTTAGPPTPSPLIVDVAEGPILFAEEPPIFPGGDLPPYLANRINYPSIARENHIEGVVYISFVVDKEGKIKDAKLLRGIGGGCDEEALRVINSLPQWKPGKQNGRAVSVIFNIPVHFKLN